LKKALPVFILLALAAVIVGIVAMFSIFANATTDEISNVSGEVDGSANVARFFLRENSLSEWSGDEDGGTAFRMINEDGDLIISICCHTPVFFETSEHSWNAAGDFFPIYVSDMLQGFDNVAEFLDGRLLALTYDFVFDSLPQQMFPLSVEVLWEEDVMLSDFTMWTENGIMSFTPTPDWFGNQELYRDEIAVMLDGERLTFDVAPIIVDDRVMVPFRVIFEALGFEVEWEAETQRVLASSHNPWWHQFWLQIGVYEMIRFQTYGAGMEGNFPAVMVELPIELDVAPIMVGDRTLVPLRAVAEATGANVEWINDTRTVEISSAVAGTSVAAVQDGSFEAQLFAAMPTDENYMISPFSLRMALAMAANGAVSDSASRSEILAALDIDDLDAFNRAAAEFIAMSNANEDVEFNIANSIWFNESRFPGAGIGFRDSFERIITDYFDGVAENVNASDAARRINAWIAEQTRDRITDVVDDEMFCEETSEVIAVLVNAIYFKGGWANPFNESATRNEIFTDRNGVETSIPMMNMTRHFSYFENEYFQMLAKPYEDRNIRMYFVLPRGDERLPFSMFEDAIDNMSMQNVHFRLPRFTTEFLHDNLVDIMRGMGVRKAFEREHFDFWDMFYPTFVGPDLLWAWIDDILQKTFIAVDEEGTEAAAATVIMMGGAGVTSMPPPPIPFHCDKLFIYFIRNDVTGDILFMGEFAFAE